MNERDYVVIPDDIGCQNFAAAGVYITRTHSVGYVGHGIFHTTVSHVVRVEVRVVFGIVACNNGIFEAGGFECRVPIFHALFYDVPPFIGEGTVHVENNGFGRFYEFTSEIGFAVFLFRFETPAMYVFGVVYTIFVAGIDILTTRKESYPTVVDTRCHRSFGKKNQRAMHSDGAIIVAGKAQYRTDFTVLRKTFRP